MRNVRRETIPIWYLPSLKQSGWLATMFAIRVGPCVTCRSASATSAGGRSEGSSANAIHSTSLTSAR